MSETAGKFQIAVPNGEPLSSGSTVHHEKYGPLTMTEARVSPLGKKAIFTIEAAADELMVAFREEDIEEMWGETMHSDPFALQDSDGQDGGESGV